MDKIRAIFQGVETLGREACGARPGRDAETALFATLTGRSPCHAFALFAQYGIDFLWRFMPLENGPPSHDAFSDLSTPSTRS